MTVEYIQHERGENEEHKNQRRIKALGNTKKHYQFRSV